MLIRETAHPRITAVVCSLNGEQRVGRCLAALAAQRHDAFEVIVVDDGSTDATGSIALAAGARLVHHETPRGLSAARNAGIAEARGDVIAFTDDDCEPAAGWLAALEQTYRAHGIGRVCGVGGVVDAAGPAGPMLRYLQLNNPLEPVERELDSNRSVRHRFARYVVRNLAPRRERGVRDVRSLVGANMSFPRAALEAVGGFDDRFTFGSDDEDVCRRLRSRFRQRPLLVNPEARVRHWFEPSLRDTLRRSAAYGRGNARMSAIYGHGAIVFPFPVLVGALLAAGVRRPVLAGAAVVAPLVLFPRGPRAALRTHDWVHLAAPYVQVLQESSTNVGFVRGWRAERRRTAAG
jgi:glycosyltransferase involved in cell wall biosynthesis